MNDRAGQIAENARANAEMICQRPNWHIQVQEARNFSAFVLELVCEAHKRHTEHFEGIVFPGIAHDQSHDLVSKKDFLISFLRSKVPFC